MVEDDPTMAEVIAGYLSHSGMLVAVASDGVMALDSFSAFKPDLVILDRMLPRLDGTHVCARRAGKKRRGEKHRAAPPGEVQ
ncbi:response regulator, partial [Amycolatopsis sp. NPDC059027]|uniref:response regulator n=1 Tax=Amycolatopsis sp. NPDC059027 TaxID=3346709 RepID=UPI00366ABD70